MKKLVATLLLCLTLFTSQISWAAALDFVVRGVDKAEHENIQKRLNLIKEAFPQPLTENAIEKIVQQAPDNIKEALRPFGYFKAAVESDLQKSAGRWQAQFIVTPGPALTLEQVTISIVGPGSNEAFFQKLIKEFPIKKGDTFKTQTYQEAKNRFFVLAENRGYLNGEFTRHEVQIDLDKYTGRIILQFNTGKKFYFGKIHFSKNPFSNKFLRRFVHFKEGDPYSTADLLILQEALSSSQYFQQIKIEPLLEKITKQQVPLDIYLTPRNPQAYTIGGGFGTDTGIRGSFAWDWRYINAEGHRMKLLTQGSQKQKIAQGNYIIPGKNPLTDQYRLSASIYHLNYPTGDTIATQLGAAAIKKWHGWQQTLALYALFDHKFHLLDQPDRKSKLLYSSLTWHKVHAKDLINAEKGYFIRFNMQGASQRVFSDFGFFQSTLEAKTIYPIFPSSKLVLRGSLGYTSIADLDDLPLTLQFLTGGAHSVRGYTYQSLGPGRYLVTGSAEFRQKISGPWSAAAFIDIGNAFKGDANLKRGVGVGILRRSPLGPLQLSVAKALDSDGKPIRIIFSMGPDLS